MSRDVFFSLSLQNEAMPDIFWNMTYLAVPIQGRNSSQCEKRLKAAGQAGAEMVELRTDYLTNLSSKSVAGLIRSSHQISLPVLVTCRDQAQGGAGNWSLPQRTDILVSAVKAGADFVDCEFSNFVNEDTQQSIRQVLSDYPKVRLILSAHDFHGPFEDIALL